MLAEGQVVVYRVHPNSITAGTAGRLVEMGCSTNATNAPYSYLGLQHEGTRRTKDLQVPEKQTRQAADLVFA
jgi:hypothetical protein